jgi:hypothetical protein
MIVKTLILVLGLIWLGRLAVSRVRKQDITFRHPRLVGWSLVGLSLLISTYTVFAALHDMQRMGEKGLTLFFLRLTLVPMALLIGLGIAIARRKAWAAVVLQLLIGVVFLIYSIWFFASLL